MIKDGKLFNKINVIDFVVVMFILSGIVGLFLVKTSRYNASKDVIKEVKQIQFDVVTKHYEITTQKDLFKEGEKSFITIRNVPHAALEIVKAVKNPPLSMQPNPADPLSPVIVEDIINSTRYTYTITFKDDAIITPDGPVVGGNKIKIGLPIEIEGFNYRFSGTVSDVKVD